MVSVLGGTVERAESCVCCVLRNAHNVVYLCLGVGLCLTIIHSEIFVYRPIVGSESECATQYTTAPHNK